MNCRLCGQAPAYARGLCRPEYNFMYRTGQIRSYPARQPHAPQRSSDEVLDDWQLVVAFAGTEPSFADLAARIGMRSKTLRQVLTRARKRGDRRAVYHSDLARACARR